MGTTQQITGDCESCERTNVVLTQQHGDMMCDECIKLENAAVATQTAIKVIETARRVDTQIELKQDVFNAATVSFVELRAAIEANSEIPTDQKAAATMAELTARIDKLTAVIFEEEAATAVKRNERHALLVNAQNFAATLQAADREKWKNYDINYKPQAPKNIKPKAVKAPSSGTTKSFGSKQRTDLFAAAKKYGVPSSSVQGIILSHPSMSADAAAKHLAGLLGLPTEVN